MSTGKFFNKQQFISSLIKMVETQWEKDWIEGQLDKITFV